MTIYHIYVHKTAWQYCHQALFSHFGSLLILNTMLITTTKHFSTRGILIYQDNKCLNEHNVVRECDFTNICCKGTPYYDAT